MIKSKLVNPLSIIGFTGVDFHVGPSAYDALRINVSLLVLTRYKSMCAKLLRNFPEVELCLSVSICFVIIYGVVG